MTGSNREVWCCWGFYHPDGFCAAYLYSLWSTKVHQSLTYKLILLLLMWVLTDHLATLMWPCCLVNTGSLGLQSVERLLYMCARSERASKVDEASTKVDSFLFTTSRVSRCSSRNSNLIHFGILFLCQIIFSIVINFNPTLQCRDTSILSVLTCSSTIFWRHDTFDYMTELDSHLRHYLFLLGGMPLQAGTFLNQQGSAVQRMISTT